VAETRPVEKIFLRNLPPFLGETKEILLGGHGDNNQQSQHCRKKFGPTVPLVDRVHHTMLFLGV
jgi:hypothetical protein